MDDLYNKYVPNVRFELIPIKDLVSNQEYQRHISIKHIEKAVDGFDINQVNCVRVSQRDGYNYVVNGQHTIEIIAAVSGSRETPVWCMIHNEELKYNKEADIFANQQKYVKQLQPYEIFKAHLEAGNDKYIIINDLVESFGLHVCPNSADFGICAVTSLVKIYEKTGYDILNRTLILIVGTWEGEAHSLSSNMLWGVAKVIYAYKDKLDDDRFKEKLGVISVRELSRTAKERRAGSLGYAEAIVLNYNKKSHGVLNIEELYKNKIPPEKNLKEKLNAPPDTKSNEPYETITEQELSDSKKESNGQLSMFEKITE
ncbi:MAG: hypothetical protein IJ224_09310 [Lachnospiraceae bacterium]|nr:hypothetical protein [Lachnospiraceae bacterium]